MMALLKWKRRPSGIYSVEWRADDYALSSLNYVRGEIDHFDGYWKWTLTALVNSNVVTAQSGRKIRYLHEARQQAEAFMARLFPNIRANDATTKGE